MRFQSEGTFPVVIRQATVAEPKFAAPPAFDVCIEVESADGCKDWWRGEVSQNYGKGNLKDRTQAQITMETLTRLGLPNNDLTQLHTLVGRQTSAYVKASDSNGRTYFNVRGLGDFAEEIQPIDPASVQARIAALFGTAPAPAPTAPVAPPVQPAVTFPAAAPAGNPFGAPGAAPAGNPFSPAPAPAANPFRR